jgi:hypothetical protein
MRLGPYFWTEKDRGKEYKVWEGIIGADVLSGLSRPSENLEILSSLPFHQ